MGDVDTLASIDIAMQQLDAKQREYNVAYERYCELQDYYFTLKRNGGVDKNTAIALENIQEGIVTKKLSLNSYTKALSKTNYDITLEQLEISMEDAGVALGFIFALIVGIITFIISLLGFSSRSGSSSNDTFIKFEKLSTMHLYFNGRTTFIDPVFTEDQYKNYREKMMAYLDRHYKNELDELKTGQSLRVAMNRGSFEKALEDFLDESFSKNVVENISELVDLTEVLRGLSMTTHKPGLVEAIFREIIRQLPLIMHDVKTIDRDVKDVIESSLKHKDAFVSRSMLNSKNKVDIIDDFVTLLNISSHGGKRIKSLTVRLDGISNHGDSLGAARMDKNTIRSVLAKLNVDQLATTKLVHKPGDRKKPQNFKAAFSAYKTRPSTVLKLEEQQPAFEAMKKAFDSKADEGERSLPATRDEATIVLREVQRHFIMAARQILEDISACIRLAIQVDKCYSDFITAYDKAFRKDCDVFTHHYQILAGLAGNESLRKNYVDMERNLREVKKNVIDG